MGDWTNAIADFRLAMKENGVYPFAAIRIWMSRVRMGERQPATAELKEVLDAPGANITNTWPRHIIKYLAGMETEPDFLNQAASPVPRKDAEQHCEAFFYIGWMRQLTGDKAAAREYFQKAIATQVTDYVEFRDAVHELQLMQ